MTIQTYNITKKYGSIEAVSLLNLTVEEGSIYGFLGPNGAGKTTTIRLLLGLLVPSAGEVMLFGQKLRRGNRHLMSKVGSLVETPSLYLHLTGRENLQVVTTLLQLPQERIAQVLDLVELAQDANRKVSEYSLGMKQRLGIALALIHQPKLLILDEPTNGLDPQGIREMREFLRSLPQRFGITVFLSSHLLSEVEQIATHIGIINHGKLLFQGTLQALQDQTRNLIAFTVDDPQKARDLLQPHLVSNPNAVQDDNTLVVRVDSDKEVPEITRRLVLEHIDIYAIVPQTLHLEDIFFQYTGTTLQPDERS
jgi:lantibiotic transport system ATP-binding protein